MFTKILIANRGEIALRIIRACKELGIKTVAVYSEIDADSLHVRFADENICIGPKKSQNSYLNIPAIISAAEISDVSAIHPGYGFLAENAHFAEICKNCNIKFIGPPPHIIALAGNKIEARALVKKAGFPVLPGSLSPLKNEKEALILSKKIGYPVILKAALGGGGRGMRIAHNDVSLINALIPVRSEAEATFTNSDIYLEKYIEKPKHIEVQILADNYGNIIHLGERECTIQRHHQKLLEEAPSISLDSKLKEKILSTAVEIAKHLKYSNVGTVEFLLDQKKKFYFIEINARVQVEHPITEIITSVDIIKEQIRLASGEKLNFRQKAIKFKGHAIECRINSENAENNFIPSCGKISVFNIPGGPGIRVDTHVYPEYTVSPYYDSLLCKLIAYGKNRQEAIIRMERALDEFIVEGVETTIPFHKKILKDGRFQKGKFYTDFVETLERRK